jgi:hypothetical protein
MGVCSPFVGQKLVNHRFGRHNIGGYNCTVYYSEFFAWYGETNEDARMVVTIIPHVSGKNPQLHYIISRDMSVGTYINVDIPNTVDNIFRDWVEMHNRVLWSNGVKKRKNHELPKIH